MRTMTSVLVEGNPRYEIIPGTRGACPACGRYVGTYLRKGDTERRVFWHRANQGEGTFPNPIQFRRCPGSGKVIS